MQDGGGQVAGSEGAERRRRSDAERNRRRILRAANVVLRTDPNASIDRIAEACEVGRATVYRHFRSRAELVVAARRQAKSDAETNERDALRPAGELAGGPTPLDVADVLNKVPPHLVGEQIVAEAQRIAGVATVALYLVDIDGSRLLRFAGSRDFPEELPVPLAVGPEVPRSVLPELERSLAMTLPGSVPAPLMLRGRAVGLLLAVGAAAAPLRELARDAALALVLAMDYTDAMAMCRRRKDMSAAAEIQQNLLPPRVARIAGAGIAGNVLPSYEVGGDWFDYVENDDGAWIGMADSTGSGPRAAALGSIALGAFRAARRSGADLEDAVAEMAEVVERVADEDQVVTAVIARWHAPSFTFRWIDRGHSRPLVVGPAGEWELLGDDDELGVPLGVSGAPTGTVRERRLMPGERLVLYSDAVADWRSPAGGRLEVAAMAGAVAGAPSATASSAVKAVAEAVLRATEDPLKDDATLVVLAPQEAAGARR